MSYPWLYLIPTLLIGLIFPAYAILTAKKTRTLLLENPALKLAAYKSTMILQIILLMLIAIAMFFNADPINQIGIAFFRQPLLVTALLISGLLCFWIIRQRKIDATEVGRLNEKNKDVLYLLPTTKTEYQWAILLSFFVGISEEILFRGFLFWRIHQYFPLIPAILLTNLIFALSHFSTKMKNMVFAFLFGVLWSITYYLTDSLWLAMLIHVVVDVYSMTEAYKVTQLSRD